MSSTVNSEAYLKRHGTPGPVPLFFGILLMGLLYVLAPLQAQAEEAYPETLIKKALQMKLYEQKRWLKLLHYKPTLFGSSSAVDDRDFFLSPKGDKDPRAELIATVKAMFQQPSGPDTHPLCRFPARAEWLKAMLLIDESRLPEVSCPELEEFLRTLAPEKAYLVFASYFMGSPASMYGHTFIIISPEGTTSKLRSYGANYAANATDTNGLLFAFKGVFGLYRGYFTVLPYYEKIKQYTNMEHRDLWEYELNLTPQEVRFMTLHLWELKNIYSYYYFFDENCSYHLLFLLDVARPDAGLTDHKGLWVIPVDTIRWAKRTSLLRDPAFRPSKGRIIKTLASALDSRMVRIAQDVATGKTPPETVLKLKQYSTLTRARALELASELIEFDYLKKKIDRHQYQRRLLQVLRARTTLGPTETLTVPVPVPPESGHASSRLTLTYGTYDNEGFGQIGFRAAYHDLYDPDQGYLPDSEIVFGEVLLRYHPDQQDLDLQSLQLLSIQSLSTRDRLFKPKSWFVRAGYYRLQGPEKLCGMYRVNTGGGLAWRLPLTGTTYIMGQTDALYSDALKTDYAVGLGLRGGFIKDISGILKMGLDLQALYYGLGQEHRRASATGVLNLRLLRDLSLRLSFTREKVFGMYHTQIEVTANVYL